MAELRLEFKDETLEKARARCREQFPAARFSVFETVISDGRALTIQEAAATSELAFATAARKVPAGATVTGRREVRGPSERVISVTAFDEVAARTAAKQLLGDGMVSNVRLSASGRKGFFGLGKRPNTYEITLFHQAIVELTHRTQPHISVLVKESKPGSKPATQQARLPSADRLPRRCSTEVLAKANSNGLTNVQYFCFCDEPDAQAAYEALRTGKTWLPIKCAVALRKASSEGIAAHWVVLYISDGMPISELPKESGPWYWHDYFEKAGLPCQDDWDESRLPDFKTIYSHRETKCIDSFLSPALAEGRYLCVACGKVFSEYQELNKHLLFSPCEAPYTKEMIRRLSRSVA